MSLHKEQDRFPFTKAESSYLIPAHLRWTHNRHETQANVTLVAFLRHIGHVQGPMLFSNYTINSKEKQHLYNSHSIYYIITLYIYLYSFQNTFVTPTTLL